MNGYFEEINGNKYLMLVPANESKGKIKKYEEYEELWIKIRDIVRSITKDLDDYDKKYIKIKFDSDDELPLHKTPINFSDAFIKNNKSYPWVFLDECLYKIKMKINELNWIKHN